MKKQIHFNSVLAIAVALLFMTCGTGKAAVEKQKVNLESYIKSYGFTPFKYPNSSYDPLTIMKFSRKADGEVIADPEDCIEDIKPLLKTDNEAITLLNTTYTLTNINKANLVFPKKILKFLSLKAGFKDSIIDSVTVQLKDPFIHYVSRIKAQRSFKNTPEDCKRELDDNKNIVVHKVLGAKGVVYRFIGKNERTINFDLNVLDSITSNPEFKRQLSANGTIENNEIMYFGYTAFKGRLSPGLISSAGVDFVELTSNELKTVIENVNNP